MKEKTDQIKRIRLWLYLFIASLVISGLTAFPLETELELLHSFLSSNEIFPDDLKWWIDRVYDGIIITYRKYPFFAYGTDWLGFAHLVIALFFIGAIQDPIKNEWVIKAGIFASITVIPFAFIAGAIRDIPFYWRIIDCSFGVMGVIPLLLVLNKINTIKKIALVKDLSKNKKALV